MPYRLNPSYSSQYFHVYNRGNNREPIFFEKKNYFYFLQKISENFKEIIDIIAYCLMINHYHLVVRINEDNSLQKAMQALSTGYTRAINNAYNRSGHLFEGRYKNKYIPNDDYLVHLCRYIHLNPIRAKLVHNLEDWEFSSYKEFLSKKNSEIINKSILLDYFKSVDSFIEFHRLYQENQNYYVSNLLFK